LPLFWTLSSLFSVAELAVLAAVSLEEQPVMDSTPAAAITPIREIKVLRFISKNSFLS
jgi:hypothetical protein